MTLKAALISMALVLGAAAAQADDSLYKDLGERAVLARVSEEAVNLWISDRRISYTFDNLNLERFKVRLTDQLCELSGGPCKYAGRNMHDSHKGLHLTSQDFDVLVEDLQLAMNKVGIPFFTQNRLLAILAPMKRDIVTR